MNWPLLRTCLLIVLMINLFNLGRMSIEFNGTRADWAILIGSFVTLITSLIGLAAGEFVRDKPKGN
jgi:hypothetical protein